VLRDAAEVVNTPGSDASRPAPWVWVVVVLAMCHAAAVATFQILNILVGPIKADLVLTDTQYSLLQGLAVAVIASALGIQAARIADHGHRRLIVLIGVTTWSVATVGCASARNFSELFAARMLVGLGEAFLYPAALSMIADVAPRQRLSTAIGIFGCGGPIGTALALIGGGWVARNADGIGSDLFWGISVTWRAGFVMCSVFGALAACLLLTVPEPRRTGILAPLKQNLAGVLSHLRLHWKVFAGVSGTMLALSYCVFAISSWSLTMLVRTHGLSYAAVGQIAGFAAVAGGMGGAWVAGAATDKLETVGHRDAALRVAIAVAALMVITTAVPVLGVRGEWAALSVCGAYCLLGMPTVLGGTALQQISPPTIRAQVMAIQVLLVNLLALSLGPLTVALLTDRLFKRPDSIGYALVWTVGIGAFVAIWAVLACRRRFVTSRVLLEPS
jgi:MFS family permease